MGVLFVIDKVGHYKCGNDPMNRAMNVVKF